MSASKGIIISNHIHPLIYVLASEKTNSAYMAGFCCSICSKNFGSTIKNYYCESCEYDICDKCLYNEIDKEMKNLK